MNKTSFEKHEGGFYFEKEKIGSAVDYSDINSVYGSSDIVCRGGRR